MPKGVHQHKIIVIRDNIRNEYGFAKNEIFVGRDSSVDLNLKNDSLSRKHFKIIFKDQKVFIEDLGSQNGTLVHGTKIPAKIPTELQLDQVITLPQGFIVSVIPSWIAEAAEIEAQLAVENGDLKSQIATSHAELANIQERGNSEVARIAELKVRQQEIEKENQATLEKIHSLHLEVRRFENERAKLIVQIEEFKTKVHEEEEESKKKIAAFLAELLDNQNAIEDSRAERALAEEQMQDAQQELESVQSRAQKNSEKADAEQIRYEGYSKKITEAKTEQISLDRNKEQLQSTIQEFEIEITRLTKDRSNAQALSQNAHKELDSFRAEIKREKEKLAEERSAAIVADRKERAEYEAYSAERKVERLRIEIEFESIQVKRAVLEKDIHLLNLKKESIDRENAETLKKIEEHEMRVSRATQRLRETEHRIIQSEARLFSNEEKIDTAKKALSQAEKEREQVLEQTEAFEKELTSRKKDFELEVTHLRTQAQTEITELTQKEQKRLDERVAREDNKVQAYYLEQIKQMDAKVAQRRLDEEKQLERIQDQSHLHIRQRRMDAAAAAAHEAKLLLGELFANSNPQEEPAQILERFEQEVRQAVLQAIDPDNKVTRPQTIGTQESQKAQRYWIKLAYAVGAVAAVGVTLAIFPQLPKNVARGVYRTLSSNKSDNVFMEEIHRKGEKFNPRTTTLYKSTYTDNILYTGRYLALKTDTEMKKKWTLALNDFFIGTLGVGDRAIVDFVAAEAVLVGELAAIAEQISVQFKDLGIKKMQDNEKQNVGRLEELVGGREGYVKFRNFEKAFYEDYIR